jgi:hypothetical protein
MPIFGVMENDVVVNSVIAETNYAAQQGWVLLPEGVGIGWARKAGVWDNPNKPTFEQKATGVRVHRNNLLAATDWTQMPDVPQAIKDKWATYRQALRDVPQQAGFPDNIQWPVKPE